MPELCTDVACIRGGLSSTVSETLQLSSTQQFMAKRTAENLALPLEQLPHVASIFETTLRPRFVCRIISTGPMTCELCRGAIEPNVLHECRLTQQGKWESVTEQKYSTGADPKFLLDRRSKNADRRSTVNRRTTRRS